MAIAFLPCARAAVQPEQPGLPGLSRARHPLRGKTIQQIAQIRYPNGSGRQFQFISYPRLTYLARLWDDGVCRVFWLVDEVVVLNLDAALEALNEPPILSEEEFKVLDLVPPDWTPPPDLHRAIAGDLPAEARAARRQVLKTLIQKGQVEVDLDAPRIRRAVSAVSCRPEHRSDNLHTVNQLGVVLRMPAKPWGDHPSARSEERPEVLPSAELIPFPLASRRPLVAELAEHFLTLPRGRQRLARFDRTVAGLIEDLRKIGVTADRAACEVAPVMGAVEAEIERRLRAREGRSA